MNKILVGLVLLVISATAYAACTTHTYTQGGRIVMCTTCCDNNGNCNTNCFQDNKMTEDQIEAALKAMHHGLLGMQARLDDHEKVIEKLMVVMQDITSAQVPDGFRQPKKLN